MTSCLEGSVGFSTAEIKTKSSFKIIAEAGWLILRDPF